MTATTAARTTNPVKRELDVIEGSDSGLDRIMRDLDRLIEELDGLDMRAGAKLNGLCGPLLDSVAEVEPTEEAPFIHDVRTKLYRASRTVDSVLNRIEAVDS